MKEINSYSFLAIGKTKETKEFDGFSRYVGIGTCQVLAVNPTKDKQDELMGYVSKEEPVYTGEENGVKFATITFIIRTIPEMCSGIESTNFLSFTIRKQAEYTNDKTKMRVIDHYGNATWALEEDAKAGKALPGNMKIASKYRIAYDGEADLVDFLRKFLCVPSALDYKGGAWCLAEKAAEGEFELEQIEKYFNGDVSEIKNAINLQPNNKIKLLFGVKTDDGKTKQRIATKGDLILRNNAGSEAFAKVETNLQNCKKSGMFTDVDFEVCELKEWTVQPTNLDNAPASAATSSDNKMPWD